MIARHQNGLEPHQADVADATLFKCDIAPEAIPTQTWSTLDGLVREANTWIIYGSSLLLEVWRGYHVWRTAFVDELHRFYDTTRIPQLPNTRRLEASTALHRLRVL